MSILADKAEDEEPRAGRQEGGMIQPSDATQAVNVGMDSVGIREKNVTGKEDQGLANLSYW
jgi:hypothetical protein